MFFGVCQIGAREPPVVTGFVVWESSSVSEQFVTLEPCVSGGGEHISGFQITDLYYRG